MQFSSLFVAVAATTAVHASLHLTDPTYAGISAGVPFEVTWADAVGDVSVILLDDTNPLDVKPLETLASGLSGTVYTWVPASTLINAFNYAIKVQDSVTTNYGAQFQFVGGVTPTASATEATSTSVPATTTSESSSEATTTSTSSDSSSITTAPSSSSTSTSFRNSTTTRGTGTSSSGSTATNSASGSETSAPSSANSIASPLALIFLTVAALLTLN